MLFLFQHILEMSISAGFVALGVILCRLVIKRVPRWISCALWVLVAVRLMIPFSIESPLSVVPQKEAVISAGERIFYHSAPVVEGLDPITPSEDELPRDQREEPKKWKEIASFIWCGVSLALLGYGVFSYFSVKGKMKDSIPLEKGIRLHEKVDSPFILGVFRPQIYLPFGLELEICHSVLLHERAHLRRMDHLAKPFAYALLCIYWFHPILWLSYFLFCRDIEAACDEKVLGDMDEAGRREYARALLKLGTKPKIITVCPVAFGETNTKERIEKTMKYKKPMFWMLALAALVVLTATVCLLTDPKADVKAEDFQDPAETEEKKDETEEEKPVVPDAAISGYTRSVAPLYTSLKDGTTYWSRAINKKTEGVSIPLMIIESREELFALLAESKETDSDWILTENEKRINEHYPEDFFKDNALLIAYTGELKRGYIASASIAAKNNGDIKVTFGYQPYPDGMGTLDDPVGYFLDCYAIPKKETDDYRTAEINMLTLKTPSPEDEVYRGVDSAGKYHYLYLWKTPITDEEPVNPKDPTPYTCQFWMGGGLFNCIYMENEKGYLVSLDLVYTDKDNDLFFQKVEGGLVYLASESKYNGRWMEDGLFLERIQ